MNKMVFPAVLDSCHRVVLDGTGKVIGLAFDELQALIASGQTEAAVHKLRSLRDVVFALGDLLYDGAPGSGTQSGIRNSMSK